MSEYSSTPPALKPCPFCCSASLLLSSNGVDNHFVTCSECDAEGPAAASEELAKILWGNRPAVIEALGNLSEARAQALDAFFRQLTHYDFSGDNPADLLKAIAARRDIIPVLEENLRVRQTVADAARYQEIRSHAGYSLSGNATQDLANYQVSCKVREGEALILYEAQLDRFVDQAIAARVAGRTPEAFIRGIAQRDE